MALISNEFGVHSQGFLYPQLEIVVDILRPFWATKSNQQGLLWVVNIIPSAAY
jgi:hypothetical protein